MTFSCVPPTELVLEVTASVQNQSWQQSQQLTTPQGRWNAYLNQMCLNTFVSWLKAESLTTAVASQFPQGVIAPADHLLSSWDVVNGTALALEAKRLVLIPDKTLETREISVPQEWVDLPSWAGDYFLAVQVNPEGEWMRCWGYTTHEHLKTVGAYDPIDRTYTLPATQLIEDLNTFWVVRQLYPNEPTQAVIETALSSLSTVEAEGLLQQLANPAIAHPRLELPFEQWGALMEQPQGSQRLYQLRQAAIASSAPAPAARPIRLGEWLQNQFDETWQAIEAVFSAQPDFAYSFRQSPSAAQGQVRRVKLLPLNSDVDQAVVLVVLLDPEPDGRISVQVQLYPPDRTSRLPATLQLSMLTVAGETVQVVTADEQADYIQLKRFKCPPGRQFQIQVAIDRLIHTEEFVS